jgi:carbon-monoxide dehydrogenase medium subunit
VGPSSVLPPLELHRPRTLSRALEQLHELGDGAHVLAGGTELLLVVRAGLAEAEHLVDIKRVPGLTSVWSSGEHVHIGGAARHVLVERAPEVARQLPALAEAERRLGNPRVRSTGTLGGNLCFAEPHSDPATVLLVHEARLQLRSVRGARELSLDDFLVGTVETAREPDEILTRIDVPILGAHGTTYLRFATAERPTAGVAAAVRLEDGQLADVRLAVGCTGPRPVRLPHAEAAAAGAAAQDGGAGLRRAAAVAAEEVEAATDGYGPADYKRHIVGLLVERALREAAERAAA